MAGLSTPRGVLGALGPAVVAILNTTPDSFFDGGRLPTVDAAVARAWQAVEEGAAAIDLGGESTRPGAEELDVEVELRRVLPVVQFLRAGGFPCPISIDTSRERVAAACLDAGADIINDVTGGTREPSILAAVARAGAAIILMHMRGTPRTMGTLCQYDDLVEDVLAELGERCAAADAAGIPRSHQAVDPGIGFAKDANQSVRLLVQTAGLLRLGRPIVVGASRKSFLGRYFGIEGEDRLVGSVVAHLHAARAGASLLRVHDVRATVCALRVDQVLSRSGRQP